MKYMEGEKGGAGRVNGCTGFRRKGGLRPVGWIMMGGIMVTVMVMCMGV